jgi:hypothetical protein
MFEFLFRLTLFTFLLALFMTGLDLIRGREVGRWALRAWASVFVVFFWALNAMIWS